MLHASSNTQLTESAFRDMNISDTRIGLVLINSNIQNPTHLSVAMVKD